MRMISPINSPKQSERRAQAAGGSAGLYLVGRVAVAEEGGGAWSGGERLHAASAIPLDRTSGFLGRRLREDEDIAGRFGGIVNQRCCGLQYLLLAAGESHFAHYRTGDFYRRHLDAFKGEENRVLSVVAYLNPDWSEEDGGELVLYPERGGAAELRVTPAQGTLVLFLSEHFEHEVLPARRDRFSIAGWFRQNNSSASRADPPA